MAEKLLIGYAREKINPPDGTPLGGYGNMGRHRLSVGKVHYSDDDLYFTVIAISDNDGNTVLACTLDLVRVRRGIALEVRKRMSEKTGVPVENIFLCATHTHSSPEVVDGYEAINPWLEIFYPAGVAAAEKAMEDRVPAAIFIGATRPFEMNFVRRYMKNGEFLGTNMVGDAHETPADNDLQMINFRREGKEDIIMINWGAHCDYSSETGSTRGTAGYHCGISADYNYALRKFVERETGAKFAFFQAAAGNLNPMTKIATESLRVKERKERECVPTYVAYGHELADYVISLYRSTLKEVYGGKPASVKEDIVFDRPPIVEKFSPEYNRAKAVVALFYGTDNFTVTEESREVASIISEKYGLGDEENMKKIASDPANENYDYARSALFMLNGGVFTNANENVQNCVRYIIRTPNFRYGGNIYTATNKIARAEKAPDANVQAELSAFSFGDIAFACPPYEMFDTNGRAIKDASPFKMTFVCEYTNDSVGYLPSKLACQHGGYEVDTMKTAEGSAEIAEGRFIAMLNGLYK